MSADSKTDYPLQIAKFGRKDVVFSTESTITPLDENDFANGATPLTLLKPWSGIKLSFADASQGDGGSGSIEYKKLDDVRIRTEIAMQYVIKEEMARDLMGDEDDKNSTSGTLVALLGLPINYVTTEMKGDRKKSAIELAMKYSYDTMVKCAKNLIAQSQKGGKMAELNARQGKAVLTAAVLWNGANIKENDISALDALVKSDQATLSRMYSAATDVGKRVLSGLNSMHQKEPNIIREYLDRKDESVSGGKIMIYDAVKTPDSNRPEKWKNGLTKCYELKVYCYPTHKQPFNVSLTTMLGVPVKNGGVGIQSGTRCNVKTFSIDLTTAEWNAAVAQGILIRNFVSQGIFGKAYMASQRILAENKNRSL